MRRVARNSFFLFANGVLGFVVRFATIPIVARYLGLNDFGLYAFIMAIAFTVGPTAAFGITRIVCRELAKDDVDQHEFFSTAALIQVLFCVFMMAVGILIIYVADWSHTTNIALLLALAGELIIALAETYLSVTMAKERMEFGMISGAIHKIALLAAICLVVTLNAGFLGIFWARLGVAVLYMLIAVGMVYSRFLRPCFCIRVNYARSIIGESISLCVARLQQALLLRVDVFVLKWLATPAAIALFEVPHRLTTQVQILASSVNMSMFPTLARNTSPDSREMLQKSYEETIRFLLVAGLFLTTAMNVCAEPFMALIFGVEFLPAVASLQVLSSVTGMLFVSTFQFSVLVALGKTRMNVICLGIALLTNFALDLALIPEYGYLGASVATLIAYSVRLAISTWFVSRENIVTMNPAIAKALLAALVSHTVLLVDLSSNAANLLARGTLTAGTYIGILVLLRVVGKNDIRALLGRRSGRDGRPFDGPGRERRGHEGNPKRPRHQGACHDR